jgi:hypothetical protein
MSFYVIAGKQSNSAIKNAEKQSNSAIKNTGKTKQITAIISE